MSRLLSFAALTVAVAAASAQSQKPTPTDPPVFDGRYTIVTGERDGAAIPDDRLVGKTIRFEKDRIVGTGADGKEFLSATYAVDATKKPWVLTMKSVLPKAGESVGLIEKDGDSVRVIYSMEDGPAPAEFKTKRKQLMLTMKVAKDGSKSTTGK